MKMQAVFWRAIQGQYQYIGRIVLGQVLETEGDLGWLDYGLMPYSKILKRPVSWQENPKEWLVALSDHYQGTELRIVVEDAQRDKDLDKQHSVYAYVVAPLVCWSLYVLTMLLLAVPCGFLIYETSKSVDTSSIEDAFEFGFFALMIVSVYGFIGIGAFIAFLIRQYRKVLARVSRSSSLPAISVSITLLVLFVISLLVPLVANLV